MKRSMTRCGAVMLILGCGLVLGCGGSADSPAEKSSGLNINIDLGTDADGKPRGLDVKVNSDEVSVEAPGVNVNVE